MSTTRKKRSSIGANFVRASPLGRPASEVVTAAKAKGIELTEKNVYQVRSRMKASAKSGKGAGVQAMHNIERSIGNGHHGPEHWETQLREAAAQLGLHRADIVLSEMRDRLIALQQSFRSERKALHRASAHAN